MLHQWLVNQASVYTEGALSLKMRRRRMKVFEEHFEKIFSEELKNGKKITVLDIGGCLSFWKTTQFKYFDAVDITIMNLSKEKIPKEDVSHIRSVVGDATNLQEYRDGEFDFCFSNSVIEHVGG